MKLFSEEQQKTVDEFLSKLDGIKPDVIKMVKVGGLILLVYMAYKLWRKYAE